MTRPQIKPARVLVAILTLIYPFLVYFGLGRFEPRMIALVLAAVALLRAVATRERVWVVGAIGAALLAAASIFGNQALPLKLYPVLVNAVLLVLFATTLLHPPSMIERLARLREPTLSPAAIRYTRRVTQVWCGFFVFNGGVALLTAALASDRVWAIYNGFVSYVLMGGLFAGEWLVRQRVRARSTHA